MDGGNSISSQSFLFPTEGDFRHRLTSPYPTSAVSFFEFDPDGSTPSASLPPSVKRGSAITGKDLEPGVSVAPEHGTSHMMGVAPKDERIEPAAAYTTHRRRATGGSEETSGESFGDGEGTGGLPSMWTMGGKGDAGRVAVGTQSFASNDRRSRGPTDDTLPFTPQLTLSSAVDRSTNSASPSLTTPRIAGAGFPSDMQRPSATSTTFLSFDDTPVLGRERIMYGGIGGVPSDFEPGKKGRKVSMGRKSSGSTVHAVSGIWQALKPSASTSGRRQSPAGPDGDLDRSFVFPTQSNGSTRSLGNQRSFLNLAASPQHPRKASVPQVMQFPKHDLTLIPLSKTVSPKTAGGAYALSDDMDEDRTSRGPPRSISAPYNLTVEHYEAMAPIAAAQLATASLTDACLVNQGPVMIARTGLGTTGMPRADSRATYGPLRQQASRVAYNPGRTAVASTAHWTTATQTLPPTARWAPQGMCDQFVLPKPRLVAHAVSPPGTPDGQVDGRVIVVSKEGPFVLEETRAASPTPSDVRVVQEGRIRDAERLEWSSKATGQKSRTRTGSLDLLSGHVDHAGRRSRPRGLASNEYNWGQAQHSKSASTGNMLHGDGPEAGIDPPSTLLVSPPVAHSFDFLPHPTLKRSNTRQASSTGRRPSLAGTLSERLLRKRTVSESSGRRGPQMSAPGANVYKYDITAGSIAKGGRSLSFNSPQPTAHTAQHQDLANEDVVIIGHQSSTSFREHRQRTTSSTKPLPALPRNRSPPTLPPIDLRRIRSVDLTMATTQLDAAETIASTQVPNRPGAHRAPSSQYSALPMPVTEPTTPTRQATWRAAHLPPRADANSPIPEPLPLATVMALASRQAHSPRHKKASMEEAVNRARNVSSVDHGRGYAGGASLHERNHSAPESVQGHSGAVASILMAAGIIPQTEGPPPFDRMSSVRSPRLSGTTGLPVLGRIAEIRPAAPSPMGSEQSSVLQLPVTPVPLNGASPMSRYDTTPATSPRNNESFDDMQAFEQDLFYSQPQHRRPWDSPIGFPSRRADVDAESTLHARPSFDSSHGSHTARKTRPALDTSAEGSEEYPVPRFPTAFASTPSLRAAAAEQQPGSPGTLFPAWAAVNPDAEGSAEVLSRVDVRKLSLSQSSDHGRPIRSPSPVEPVLSHRASIIPELGVVLSDEDLRHGSLLAGGSGGGGSRERGSSEAGTRDSATFSLVGEFPSPPRNPDTLRLSAGGGSSPLRNETSASPTLVSDGNTEDGRIEKLRYRLATMDKTDEEEMMTPMQERQEPTFLRPPMMERTGTKQSYMSSAADSFHTAVETQSSEGH